MALAESEFKVPLNTVACDDSTGADSAPLAGLIYGGDDRPGITRRRVGKGFTYLDVDGRPLRDRQRIRWIKSLAIPPAWQQVWIAPDPRCHILATGRDAKGRKQYRYHAAWFAMRDAQKFERIIAFGEALPAIRERVEADLARQGLPRQKVLALVLKMLEATLIRVGNSAYAKANRTFGLTTLRSRHLVVEGSRLRFEFRGKSGKELTVTVRDRRLAQLIRRLQELPGQELFQYLDEDGLRQTVTSADVNEYLRSIAAREFSAKDFRTWAGTGLAAWLLRHAPPPGSPTAAKRQLNAVIRQVAGRLGNTMAICRKSYIHPAVIEAYLAGALSQRLASTVAPQNLEEWTELVLGEAELLAFLKACSVLSGDAAPEPRDPTAPEP